jgi:hypothetical protein
MRATNASLDRRYWAEIAVVLIGKALALLLLYLLFFARPPAVPPPAAHLFSQDVHP